jgi:hypothetical protein
MQNFLENTNLTFLLLSLLKGFAVLFIIFLAGVLLFFIFKSIILYYIIKIAKHLLQNQNNELLDTEEKNLSNKEDEMLRDKEQEKEQEKVEKINVKKINKQHQEQNSKIFIQKPQGRWQNFIFNQRKGIINAVMLDMKQGKDIQFWRTLIKMQRNQGQFFDKNRGGRS